MSDLPKNWWASKTIWASLLATVWPLATVLSKQLGFELPAADTLAGALGDIGTVALSAIAIYGRVTAKTSIATPGNPKAPAAVLVLLALSSLCVLSACSSTQQQTAIAAAPVIVQTAEAVDPSISPAVAKACTIATAVASAAVAVAPADTKARGAKALTDASCVKPGAQQALTANDKAAVTASNSGNSANWLLTTVLPDALAAAKLAIAVAPLL